MRNISKDPLTKNFDWEPSNACCMSRWGTNVGDKNPKFTCLLPPFQNKSGMLVVALHGLGKSIKKHGWNKLVRDCPSCK